MKSVIGKVFGHLTIISLSETKIYHKTAYNCVCVCGNTKVLPWNDLSRGKIKSCGCLQYGRSIKHGHALKSNKSKEYTIWLGIRDRCYRINNPAYPNYGGRGITVCDEWRNDFNKFFSDMGFCPEGHSLDRKNNDAGYSKENCRWATRLEQNNNTRANRNLTFKGRTQTVSKWSRELNIHPGVIRNRIVSLDWSVEEALSTPIKKPTDKRRKKRLNKN